MVEKIFSWCNSASCLTSAALGPGLWCLVFHTKCFLSFCTEMIFQPNVTATQYTESLSHRTLGIKGLSKGNKTISSVIKIITNHKINYFLNNVVVQLMLIFLLVLKPSTESLSRRLKEQNKKGGVWCFKEELMILNGKKHCYHISPRANNKPASDVK